MKQWQMATFVEEMQTATANIHPGGAAKFRNKKTNYEGIAFAFLKLLLNKHMKGHQSALNNPPLFS